MLSCFLHHSKSALWSFKWFPPHWCMKDVSIVKVALFTVTPLVSHMFNFASRAAHLPSQLAENQIAEVCTPYACPKEQTG